MPLPEPNAYASLGWIVVGIAALATMGNQVHAWIDRLKDKPAPAEVAKEAAERFVTKAQCEKHHDMISARIAFLDGQRVTDMKDAAESRRGIYGKIDGLKDQLEARIEGVSAQLPEMERRLNASDESRTSDLHSRINTILEAVGELRGEVKRMSQTKKA